MKRAPPSALSHDPAVLFVVVGWADDYNGHTTITGNHKYLRIQGSGEDCSEMRMYRPRRGYFRCGIGRGEPKVEQLDVVFVAQKNPATPHRIVAVYFGVECYQASDDSHYWWARTPDILPLRGSERVEVEWPVGQGMRRWAYRAGAAGHEHFHLYRAYCRLLRSRTIEAQREL